MVNGKKTSLKFGLMGDQFKDITKHFWWLIFYKFARLKRLFINKITRNVISACAYCSCMFIFKTEQSVSRVLTR